jgi:ketosteroid isomerase-like protein
MSQENEHFKVVRRFHDALNHRDVDAMVAVWAEDAEFRPIMSALDGQVYQGHDGLRAWLDAIFADWEVFEAYDDEFRDLGDRVLSFGHWHARGRASGVVLDVDTAAWLVGVREGKIVSWQTFTDRAEALEAVGLSEAQENVDIVRRSMDLWNSGDVGALVATFTDDAELQPAPGFIWGGRLLGHEGIRHFFERLHEAWKPGDTVTLGEVREAGDKGDVLISVASHRRRQRNRDCIGVDGGRHFSRRPHCAHADLLGPR